jgi:hypothetical protein
MGPDDQLGGVFVFRKKSRGQVIGAELQEGLSHLGTALAEAGRVAAEEFGPRVEAAREALEARRDELAAATAQATKQAKKKAKKTTAKQRKQLEKKAAKATATVKRKVGAEPEPRRWPWLIAVLGIAAGGVLFSVLRRRTHNDDLWPAPAGDGPVPSYREDPVPSSPSDSGKTVSSAQTSAGDATPPDTDLGVQAPQAPVEERAEPNVPGSGTGGPSNDELNTMINGPDGADRGQEPGGKKG